MKIEINNKIAKEIRSYLIAKDENILYVGKPSAVVLIPRYFVLLVIVFLLYFSTHFIFLNLLSNLIYYTLTLISLIILSSICAIFLLIDWYVDYYIVTNKKIIEMSYAPPISHNLSSILLDEVRCTEVDMVRNGLFHELLDIGDVVVTFDRPTHHETFVLHNISHPEPVSLYLSYALTESKEHGDAKPFWYRSSLPDHRLIMGNDSFSRKNYQLI